MRGITFTFAGMPSTRRLTALASLTRVQGVLLMIPFAWEAYCWLRETRPVMVKRLLPVLAGYISYAIAGRPGLVPGFVGGYLAMQEEAFGGVDRWRKG